ncbi:MAG: FAD-binding protein [Xanthobacteraceae bacterium]|nr:FAD-binding protein [Xanthobacteraceae bacterium]
MTGRSTYSEAALSADVLVIGGGLAGTWAAVAAAREGAQVVLTEKGYCGTSGVTATAGPGHWWVPPDPQLRAEAIRRRQLTSFGLADSHWMARILDTTWRTLPTIANYYDFSVDDSGAIHYRSLRGPEYMRAMRRLTEDAGVRILDQSPALELLLHNDGSVAGARGLRRQEQQEWTVRAGAVVLATGGCAFMSKLLGSQTNTGDGQLMAAEAGAELSGMEFSTYHTVAPVFSNMTRSMSYAFATYLDAAGRELAIPQGPDSTRALARELLKGPVFCHLGRMPDDIRAVLTRISPNFMLPFVRRRIDPFSQPFEVTLRGEGTVRGTGGLRVIADDCRTTVPGLFAAGDTATRERVAGATSGGGAQNSAWALSSGLWAGRGAARLARERGQGSERPVGAIGGAGLRPRQPAAAGPSAAEAIAAMQGEMLPFDKAIFRSGGKLKHSLSVLDDLWRDLRASLGGRGLALAKARETAALVASARWCTAAAYIRKESRGMHQREDAPQLDERFARRLLIGGTDWIWTRFDEPVPELERAAS